MILKLLNDTVLTIEGIDTVNNTLRIQFAGKTPAELETIFSDPVQLATLRVFEKDVLIAQLVGYTDYSGQFFKDSISMVILTKPANVDVANIVTALANSQQALAISNEAATTANAAVDTAADASNAAKAATDALNDASNRVNNIDAAVSELSTSVENRFSDVENALCEQSTAL